MSPPLNYRCKLRLRYSILQLTFKSEAQNLSRRSFGDLCEQNTYLEIRKKLLMKNLVKLLCNYPISLGMIEKKNFRNVG